MGVVSSHILKKVRRFNVENRAHRALDRKKPVTAPRYPTEAKVYTENIEALPNFKDELNKKDSKLDDYLKKVYVKSTEMTPEIKRDTSRFPKMREAAEETEYGFWEPKEVPEGKVSLKQIIKFITDHQGDKNLWTASKIAKEYKLDEKTVEHVLEYNRTFNIYIPAIQKDSGGIYSLKHMISNTKDVLLPYSRNDQDSSQPQQEKKEDKT